jgi:formylglycine-generating enzyme required for sulfatase activity
LPGYADKAAQPARITVPVPTCDATRHQTVHVPAGPFVYGGPGEPRTRFTSYEQPERVIDLAAFRIDVLEVSNRQFGSFAELAGLTGYAAPVYSTNAAFAAAAGPDMPVAGIDAFTAEAFCRFMGKRLPTDFEWTKAARGGLDIAGSPNPHPRRLFPWGPTAGPCANIEGAADGSAWMSPVTSLACGASPYSVLNLAGNVAEWIAREGQTDTIPQRVVRGGGADSPPALEHHTTVFRNSREARSFWYTIGVRCVEGEAGVTQ